MHRRARLGLALLAFGALTCTAADIPALADLSEPVATIRPDLVQQRALLVQERSSLRQQTLAHNASCQAVESGSAQSAQCRQALGALSTEVNRHILESNKFNAAAHKATGDLVVLLRKEAQEEWYWFTVNQFDVMTAAFWAGVSRDPMGPPVDAMAAEARQRLRKYLVIVRELESITHTAQLAEQRYEHRVQNLRVARQGSYAILQSQGTLTTDLYPPSDLAPWSDDERVRQGAKCIFDRAGKLRCQ